MRRSPSSFLLIGVVACAGSPKPSAPQPCLPDRAVVLAGQDDVAALAGCATARSLAIRTGVALDLAPLASLASITGDLRIGPTVALDELRLDQLRSVGGSVVIASNGDLHGVFLPRLERAGALAIEGNVALTTISLPALRTVTGNLAITRSGDLGLVELSSLATVGGELAITDNPKLTLLELAGLERAASIRLDNNRSVPAEVVDAVRARATPP